MKLTMRLGRFSFLCGLVFASCAKITLNSLPSNIGGGTTSGATTSGGTTSGGTTTPLDGSIHIFSNLVVQARQKAAANTPQWVAFKNQLDSNLPVDVAIGSYQGSQFPLISDYALGYQALKDTDPTTAANYADKAISLIKSALSDYPRSSTTYQFLARGDGVTRSFTLANADYIPSSLIVFVAPVNVATVTKGTAHGQDPADYYVKFLKVSLTSDGPPAYTEGVDWAHDTIYANNNIDWSLGGREPATGSTYYVSEASLFSTSEVPFTMNGATITLSTPPAANQVIFVDYVYGTRAADYSTLAYQQTSAGGGGFVSIKVDDGYTSRYLGKHVAMGYDWLYAYPGFSASLRTQCETMLGKWYNYNRNHGYSYSSPASNYGAGEYASGLLTALALDGRATFTVTDGSSANGYDGNAVGVAALDDMTSYRSTNLVPLLSNQTTSLYGGFWAEGWNYGQLASRNVLQASLAWEAAGHGTATEERAWAAQVIYWLLGSQPTPTTGYDAGDWYAYPAPFVGNDEFYLTAAAATDTTAQSYANYFIQHGGGQQTNDFQDLLFRDPNATAQNWTSSFPLQTYAQGSGLVIARADWSYASTWVSFQLGNLLNADHQTNAPGLIEIQRGADTLLVNPGAYSGPLGGHDRTQYSNTIVIDSNGGGSGPTSQTYPFNMGVWYGTPGCTINQYEATDTYVYAGGDYRASYSPAGYDGSGGPATELTRQWVYVRPDYVVIHDRVGTQAANYPKQFRLNFISAPTLSGNAFTVAIGSSKLFGTTFGTEKDTVAPIPLTTSSSSVSPDGNAPVNELITVNTSDALNVRYTTFFQSAPSNGTMAATSFIQSADGSLEGIQFGTSFVGFGKDGAIASTQSYTITGSSAVTHLIVDLVPGHGYSITVNNGVGNQSLTASSQGTLSFTTTPTGSPQKVTIQ